MATMRVDLVSPERVVFSGEGTMVLVRTLGGGEIAFLPGHAPFVAALTGHVARVALADGSTLVAAIHGGFVEVSNGKVAILSDLSEMSDAVDVVRCARADERAGTVGADDADAADAASDALVDAFELFDVLYAPAVEPGADVPRRLPRAVETAGVE